MLLKRRTRKVINLFPCQILSEGEGEGGGGSPTPSAPSPSLASSVDLTTPAKEPAPAAPSPKDTAPAPPVKQDEPAIVKPDAAKPLPEVPGSDKASPPVTEGKTDQNKAPVKADAPAPEAEPIVDESEIIPVDQLVKRFPNIPKAARAYIERLTNTVTASEGTATMVENLGGKEGLDLLMEMADVLSNPKAGDKFDAMLEKFPHHRKAFANKVFWQEANDVKPGGSMDQLVRDVTQTRIGQEVPLDDFYMVCDAIKSGEIDLEQLREKAELQVSKPERERRERETAESKRKDEENATLRKQLEETQATKKQDRVDSTAKSFTTSAEAKWKPIAESLGLLPTAADPPDVVQYKNNHIRHLLRDVDDFLRNDPDYEAWWAMVQDEEDASNSISYKIKFANIVNKAKQRFDDLARAQQDFFTAGVAGLNSRERKAIAETPAEPTGAPTISSPADRIDDANLSPEERAKRRKANFQRTLEAEIAKAA